MEKIVILCDKGADRIDSFISENTEISRSRAVKLIESGNVTVNGKTVNKKTSLKVGDGLEITLPDPVPLEAKAEDISLEIVYEDNDLLVVNKPKGMVVHPAAGNFEGTLVNALLSHCQNSLSGIGGVMRPGILHRIDKNTSGLLIVAKNDTAHTFLAAQIKEHSFLREYEAVVYGNLKNDSGTINVPIGRHPVKRKQMAVVYRNSKPAVTHYEVIARYDGFTHIKCRLETGRTHQIRVHMASLGHAVAGDDVYGPKKVIKELGGQCLHARKIGFIHPNGEYLEFSSDLPDYFNNFLSKLERKS
ncbi:MAG: RluA family pseudouridine synthase [Ruminococcaceae bacterium]|nr:RluA family pseudouridine synthase [Oscillospiraceae bacterium]